MWNGRLVWWLVYEQSFRLRGCFVLLPGVSPKRLHAPATKYRVLRTEEGRGGSVLRAVWASTGGCAEAADLRPRSWVLRTGEERARVVEGVIGGGGRGEAVQALLVDPLSESGI